MKIPSPQLVPDKTDFDRRSSWIIVVLGCYALVGGLSTFIGWVADIQRLTDWVNSGISMMPNMAVALMLAGMALVLRSFGHQRTAAVLGLVTCLIGGATLFQHITGINLGIDTLLVSRPWGQRGTLAPGRIGPPGSASLTLIGTAIVLAASGRNRRKAAVIGGLLVICITLLSITGYLFGADSLYSLPRLTVIAFQTSTFLLALGIGLVMSVPEVQPMKMLRGNSAAAALVRRALPFIILLPLIVGWLRLQGENSGMYDSAFGIALRTVVEVVLLVGLLWWAASAVKARETPLRESEELSRTLFNSAPMAILSCDRDGVVQHYNRRAVELWGREPARGIERNSGSVKLWRPDGTFLPREQSPMVEVLRTGIPTHNVELFIERPDGSRLPILANFVALKNQQGEITGAIASFIDISERKQTEMNLSFLASVSQDLAQLKTVDEMMRNVGAKIGMHFHLSLCNFVEINEAANEAVVTHNWHREDVPGNVGVYKLSEYLTDDFQKTCRAGELFIVRDSATDPRTDAEKYAALQLRSFVCVPQMRNGQWKFLLNVHDSKPRDWRGDEIELIREVAARLWSRLERVRAEEALRESEKKFRAMADSIPQLAWTADATGFIHWYNRRWYEYTGTTLKDMEGWGWQSVHDPKTLPKVMERWQASIATGDSLDMVFPLRRADGQFRSFLTRVNSLKDDQGRVVQWFGTNTDIEDQKHAEEKLERTVAQRTEALRETNEQLEAFVYSISHDLRAPLRSMQGFSQLLVDDHAATLDDAAKNYLARINRSAEFMDNLIMDLLAFGRTSRAEMELASVQVQKAWDNALFQCGTEIEKTKAKIEAIPPLPTVHAHETTLSQALANLLSNALKFVSPGVAPHIRFWAEENGNAVRLWIQDNGLGIPKEQHERVFRVFERLQGARYPGTGIGLSIVRKGVERMNGKMGLESEPGQGSRFWIELPKG